MVEPSAYHSCPVSPNIGDLSGHEQKEPTQNEHVALDDFVWKKLDRWILPLCTCFSLLSAMDKINIANARVAGLQKSLAMSNSQYAIVLTAAYAPFIASEFPSTLLLKHVGPDLMLPAMISLGGVFTALQGFITKYYGLLACRLFLGLVEGGLSPCVMIYLSSFYPRKRLQIRVAVFYASISLSGTFSGLLASAISRLNRRGGKPGWAWIFILEGLFTFVFGVISFLLLPRSPETARFLTEKERAYVISTLKRAGSVSDDDDKDGFSWIEVVRAVKSLHVCLLAVMAFFSGTIMYGLASFEPTIIADLGYTGNQAQLMSVPPFATTCALCFISSIISDRYHCRGYTIIFFSLLKAIGFAMFYASTSSHVRYASLFFSVTGSICVLPAMITWLTNNSAPHTRRATAVALVSVMSELGGILGTWLLGSLSPAPNYTSAMITFIAMSISMVVLSTANLAYLWRQNRLKAERRQRMRKEEEPAGLGDRSAWFVYSL